MRRCVRGIGLSWILVVLIGSCLGVSSAAARGRHWGNPRPASTPRVTVLASGLNSPKHLTYTRWGVYVAESGVGGTDCVQGPPVSGPPTPTVPYCEGPTGAIALIRHHNVRVVASGLPSVISDGEVLGPAAVSVGWPGQLSIVYDDELVDSNGTNGLPDPAATVFGTLRITPAVSADLAAFAAAHPQTLPANGVPGETPYDSDPYDVTPYRGGFVVADAAADDLLFVTPRGRISLLARFPTENETPPSFLGLPFNPTAAEAVPTATAVGPDGALYVSTLNGVPSDPGDAVIYRVIPGRQPQVWATGLSALTALAFGPRGRLYATELSTAGLLGAPTTPGALVEVSRNGTEVSVVSLPSSVTLTEPTGVAVAPDGTVYVANNGTSSATDNPPGEVLAITGLG
jgi:hypothetical protein